MSSNTVILFFMLGCLMSSCTQTPSTPPMSPPELLRVPLVSTIDQQERDYFLYLPKGYQQSVEKGGKLPVLLFLHGDGERGNGKEELDFVITHGPLYEAWIQKRDLPFILIVPQLPKFGRDKLPGLEFLANRKKKRYSQKTGTGSSSKTRIVPHRRQDERSCSCRHA